MDGSSQILNLLPVLGGLNTPGTEAEMGVTEPLLGASPHPFVSNLLPHRGGSGAPNIRSPPGEQHLAFLSFLLLTLHSPHIHVCRGGELKLILSLLSDS